MDQGLRLCVAVHDQGVGPNSPRANPDPDPGPNPEPEPGLAGSGRGLLVVRALGGSWGVRDARPASGRVVWAELPYGVAGPAARGRA